MKRGEVWTLRDNNYASKARPVIVIQDESVATFDSIILCLLTTHDIGDSKARVRIEPPVSNGLEKPSYAMADKIATVKKDMLGESVGAIEPDDLHRVDIALKRVLGLVGYN